MSLQLGATRNVKIRICDVGAFEINADCKQFTDLLVSHMPGQAFIC